MDGLDTALVSIDEDKLELVDFISPPLDQYLKFRLLELCSEGKTRLSNLGEIDHELALQFSNCVSQILERNQLAADDITAIGSHGQTIWHQPRQHPDDSTIPFTMQIADPNLICHLTGIATVADFRRRDMAAGGQGAPMVPAFHAWYFRAAKQDHMILNIGGFSNLTFIPASSDDKVSAYDTGTGNVLLDAWIRKCIGHEYDESGQWAASGKVNEELLKLFMADPYLALQPPKSTGRELFNMEWLEEKFQHCESEVSQEDVQATLLEFTAATISTAINANSDSGDVIVCGGGSRNALLMSRLNDHLPHHNVMTSEEKGMNPDAMEASAFAWMARQTIKGHAVDLCSITGARSPVIIGGIYSK